MGVRVCAGSLQETACATRCPLTLARVISQSVHSARLHQVRNAAVRWTSAGRRCDCSSVGPGSRSLQRLRSAGRLRLPKVQVDRILGPYYGFPEVLGRIPARPEEASSGGRADGAGMFRHRRSLKVLTTPERRKIILARGGRLVDQPESRKIKRLHRKDGGPRRLRPVPRNPARLLTSRLIRRRRSSGLLIAIALDGATEQVAQGGLINRRTRRAVGARRDRGEQPRLYRSRSPWTDSEEAARWSSRVSRVDAERAPIVS